MINFHRHKRHKRAWKEFFFNRYVTTAVGLVLLILVSIPLSGNIARQYQVNKEIEELEQKIEGLKGENREMQDLLEYLESDQYVLEQARQNLNYKKDGEKVVVIKDVDETAESAANTAEDDMFNRDREDEPGNPARWWKYFFH